MSSAGPLRSTGVTPLRRYYQPLRHPLVFGRFPGVAGYTAYLAPLLSRRDEEGFSSCSMCPGHRAVAPTPPEGPAASAALRQFLLPSPSGWGLGLRVFALSGPPLRSLALRPGDSPAIPRMAVSMGFRPVGFPPACHPGYGASALPPAGLTPAEHISLFWTHNRTGTFQCIRLKHRTTPLRGTTGRGSTGPRHPLRSAVSPLALGSTWTVLRQSRLPKIGGGRTYGRCRPRQICFAPRTG